MSNASMDIWDPTGDAKAAKSLDDIMARYQSLQGVEREPSPLLLEFGHRLQAHMEQQPDLFEDDDYLATEGSRVAEQVAACRSALFSLQLPYSNTLQMRVRAAVVDIAFDLGLMVLDESIAMGCAPGRKMYPVSRARDWKGVVEYLAIQQEEGAFPSTLAGFARIALPALDLMVRKWGFERAETEAKEKHYVVYERYIDLGRQAVSFLCFESRGRHGYAVTVDFSFKYPLIVDLCRSVGFSEGSGTISDDIWAYNETLPFPKPAEVGGVGRHFPISDSDSFEFYMEMLSDNLFKILDIGATITGLNELANQGHNYPALRRFIQTRGCMPACLVIARLVNNPDFERLAIELPQKANWGNYNINIHREAWPKLVEILRNYNG